MPPSAPAAKVISDVARHDFALDVGDECLACDRMTAAGNIGDNIHTLFLHGAGQSTRERQRVLREELARHGMGSAACDFSGHGASTANAPNTLKKREAEAQALLEQATRPERTVVGVSMGGEIAMRLACRPENRITHLVTLVGAIYDAAALALPFGPAFTAALRREHSWRDAGVLSQIEGFRGHITLIRGMEDTVIPHEIAGLIRQHARQAQSCRIIDLPGVDHRLSEHCTRDAALRAQVARWIARPGAAV